MNDMREKIRTELELENSEFLAALRSTAMEEIRLVDDESDAVTHAMREIEQATDKATAATKRKQKATEDAKDASAAYRMNMQQLSYAINDFASAQGDFGQKLNAVANNLQMLAVNLGLGGGVTLAITGLITLVQTLSRNWESLVGLFKSTDTTAAATSIDAITEALNKLNAAQQKQADQRKATEAQKAAGRGFARAVGQAGGLQTMLQTTQDLGWDVGQMEELLNRGLGGEEDAVDQLGEWLRTSGRGRNGQMPILSKLGGLYRGAIGERAGRRRAAETKMLNEQGAAFEDETNAKAFNERVADEQAAARQAGQDEAHNRQVAARATESLAESMRRFNEKMDAREGRAGQAAANWAAGRAVQEEAMQGYGQAIDINTATQIAKQREAEMKRLQGEAINTLIGTQADFMAEMQQARQQLAFAKRLQQMNRTQQNMGGN